MDSTYITDYQHVIRYFVEGLIVILEQPPTKSIRCPIRNILGAWHLQHAKAWDYGRSFSIPSLEYCWDWVSWGNPSSRGHFSGYASPYSIFFHAMTVELAFHELGQSSGHGLGTVGRDFELDVGFSS